MIATDSSGCVDQRTCTIVEEGSITAWIQADTLVAWGDSTVLVCTMQPLDSTAAFLWSPMTGLEDPYAAQTACTIADTSSYVVTVTSAFGCVATDSVVVIPDPTPPTIIVDPCGDAFLPDIFSPNGDGLNDLLCPLGGCWTYISLMVYDRWGQRIFTSSAGMECWDGTREGRVVPDGTYMFTFDAGRTTGERVARTGTLTLRR